MILNAVTSGRSRCLPAAMALLFMAGCADPGPASRSIPVRVATFNASLHRFNAGDLARDLAAASDSQAMMVAEVIQRVRPDIILLNEFDFDSTAARMFVSDYLTRPQLVSGAADSTEPIDYPYLFQAPVNTGVASGHDLDHDGVLGQSGRSYGGDAWGFGFFPGQYGMLILSRYPIDTAAVRTFRKFRWVDLPDPLLPAAGDGEAWYPPEVLADFPLSSKSHWDVPVSIGGRSLRLLASHPTPPVFDGPEDRNGRRNHDEIRFWADYLDRHRGDDFTDDQGRRGGVAPGASFIVLGDLNSDPYDGDGLREGIRLLLEHPLIFLDSTPASAGGARAAELQGGANDEQLGDPRFDTADFDDDNGPGNLRLDYLLPSRNLRVTGGGVFWPLPGDSLEPLLKASDHRLVWLDLQLDAGG